LAGLEEGLQNAKEANGDKMRHVRESGAVIKPKLVHMLSPFGGTVLHIHYFRRNKLSDGS